MLGPPGRESATSRLGAPERLGAFARRIEASDADIGESPLVERREETPLLRPRSPTGEQRDEAPPRRGVAPRLFVHEAGFLHCTEDGLPGRARRPPTPRL